MKFSIVIALYNKASYITATINSVLAQTCQDFEIIVVDDGSSDGGAALAMASGDTRLRLLRQANAGVSVARNAGIDVARGEWVAFLDADDWLHPDYLATLVKAQRRFPQADTVATGFITVPDTRADTTEPWPPRWPDLGQDPPIELVTDLARRWIGPQCLCASSIAVRARRLKYMQPCFPPGESLGEDLDLWFRLAERSPVALVASPLVAYRVEVKDSLTNSHAVPFLPPCFERMRLRAVTGALTPVQKRSALWLVAQHEVSLARVALAAGQRAEALQWLYRGRRAAVGKRWWMTAAMTFLFPRSLAKNWQDWRVQQAGHSIDARTAGG